jgi:hypothetical protein
MLDTALGSEREAAAHIHGTQVVEARWADRTGMEGKVLGHSVVVAVVSCGWEDQADVSWLVVLATGSSMESAATLRLSCRLGPAPLAHRVVDLSSVVSICDEEQILRHLLLGRLGRKRYPGAPS